MKPGAQYEEFVYEKLRRFFVDARLTKNDKSMVARAESKGKSTSRSV